MNNLLNLSGGGDVLMRIIMGIFSVYLVLTSRWYMNLVWMTAAAISIDTNQRDLYFSIAVLEVLISFLVLWGFLCKICHTITKKVFSL